MLEKELRALLAVKNQSLVVVQKKFRTLRMVGSPTHPTGLTKRCRVGWIAYAVPLSKKPKRDFSIEEDICCFGEKLRKRRGDAIKRFMRRSFE